RANTVASSSANPVSKKTFWPIFPLMLRAHRSVKRRHFLVVLGCKFGVLFSALIAVFRKGIQYPDGVRKLLCENYAVSPRCKLATTGTATAPRFHSADWLTGSDEPQFCG